MSDKNKGIEDVLDAVKGIDAGLQVKFDGLKGALETRLAAVEEQSKSAKDGALDPATKDQIKNISEEIVELKKSMGNQVVPASNLKSLSAQIKKGLDENRAKFKSEKKGFNFNVDGLHMKAVGNMSSSGNLTADAGYFLDPYTVPGVFMQPYELQHIRDIIPSSTLTNSDKVAYITDESGEGGPAEVAEGGAKPKTDRDFKKNINLVSKIAHYFKIPEEMIDDNDFLLSAIQIIGLAELKKKEDNLFLTKNGAGQEFDGLLISATAFSDPTGTDLTQKYDVLIAAATQIRNNLQSANFILMNPSDIADLLLVKDSQGRYIFPEAINSGVPRVLGIPIIGHTLMTADNFLIGDRNASRIWDRMGANIRFYDQNEDDAIKNMSTVVIEERTTLTTFYKKAYVTGVFSTIIAGA